MRTFKLLLCACLVIVATLLVTDVLDLCRVQSSGEIEFAPRVERSALSRWSTGVAEFFSPAEEAPAPVHDATPVRGVTPVRGDTGAASSDGAGSAASFARR